MPVCEEVVGAPRQVLELERPAEPLADGLEHLDGFGSDVLADPVTGNDCYSHSSIAMANRVQFMTRATQGLLSRL